MNWKTGQEIICIKSHSQGYVKKDKIYTIKRLRQSCNCGTDIDVGARGTGGFLAYAMRCTSCGFFAYQGQDNTAWIIDDLFAPLEYNKEAIEELIKEQIPQSHE